MASTLPGEHLRGAAQLVVAVGILGSLCVPVRPESNDPCRVCYRLARSDQRQIHQPEAGGFVPAPVLGFQDDNGRRDDLAAITTVKTRSNLCYPR